MNKTSTAPRNDYISLWLSLAELALFQSRKLSEYWTRYERLNHFLW
jgi:hypothetical protein